MEDNIIDEGSLLTFKGPYRYESGRSVGKWYIKVWTRRDIKLPFKFLKGKKTYSGFLTAATAAEYGRALIADSIAQLKAQDAAGAGEAAEEGAGDHDDEHDQQGQHDGAADGARAAVNGAAAAREAVGEEHQQANEELALPTCSAPSTAVPTGAVSARALPTAAAPASSEPTVPAPARAEPTFASALVPFLRAGF
jgi:hypothetical protein